jgi:putative flippase GtrA
MRSALSSGVATASDFALVSLLAGALGLYAPIATFIGCVTGGFINFTINRSWAFRSSLSRGRSMMRYVFVTASSAFLNSGLVAVLLLFPRMSYQLAWVVVRVLVFVTWNYPLHRNYVFAARSVTPGDAPSI